QLVVDDARVVYQDVETPPLPADSLNARFGRRRVGHVGLESNGRAALFYNRPNDLFSSGLVATINDANTSPLGGERLGDATTDAAASARYQGYLILQP